MAKAKAKKAALANESAATDNPAEPSSAVAAEAINSPSATDSSINAAPVDDKKAKIAAAVAKAKAKKAALANELTQTDESAVSSTVVNQAIKTASDVDMTNSEAPIDDKKAKIAAAVAKAKAKKLANSAKQEE